MGCLRIAPLNFEEVLRLETPQNMGLLRIMAQKLPQNEGSSNITAPKDTPKHEILNSRCTERSHCSENATRRRIFDFVV